ncbi:MULTISPECIES: electron transfer flavoprotein subunit alpha/FixB family protein [Clostridium]|nr:MULTISPECIES: electron transfer flavoprotein subunit alpha/FixB family protein [Clostridium]AQR93027.1 electron transfer flavoprotein subunit alpha [Clostridium saccharoperbutylacetonicum]NRT59361.1 electron transfer flavoprotein alpha subunit [Clostridium saccharoperbutylacetonicum]NSB28552.1 electron transfer flavoprotein alpha subunit [Clostridium saccharoperbutylacetonicum]NSB34438.1 electron transfer flavoprotein alpha subunit [Clostridium saccharoperbutylacetonicum]NSB42043.1 electron
MKNIIVICEEDNKVITQLSLQMISKAHELINGIDGEVTIVVPNREALIELPITANIYNVIECSDLRRISRNQTSELLVEMITMYMPNLVLFPDCDWWRSVAASMASVLNAGIVADCIEIEYNSNIEQFVFHRTAYVGSKEAIVVGKDTKTILGVVKKNAFNEKKLGKMPLKIDTFYYDKEKKSDIILIRKRERILNHDISLQLEGKKIIFGVGRGVDSESLAILKKIAKHLGAGLGYSRPMIEREVGTSDLQIGQSGCFIQPDLYIAFGISGSIHHACGILNSKKIIAVNKDCNASIFEYSDIGIICDSGEIIRKIGEKIFS